MESLVKMCIKTVKEYCSPSSSPDYLKLERNLKFTAEKVTFKNFNLINTFPFQEIFIIHYFYYRSIKVRHLYQNYILHLPHMRNIYDKNSKSNLKVWRGIVVTKNREHISHCPRRQGQYDFTCPFCLSPRYRPRKLSQQRGPVLSYMGCCFEVVKKNTKRVFILKSSKHSPKLISKTEGSLMID